MKLSFVTRLKLLAGPGLLLYGTLCVLFNVNAPLGVLLLLAGNFILLDGRVSAIEERLKFEDAQKNVDKADESNGQ